MPKHPVQTTPAQVRHRKILPMAFLTCAAFIGFSVSYGDNPDCLPALDELRNRPVKCSADIPGIQSEYLCIQHQISCGIAEFFIKISTLITSEYKVIFYSFGENKPDHCINSMFIVYHQPYRQMQ